MMKDNKTKGIRAIIVIPTFNNYSSLKRVVMSAMDTGLDVLVVNDGSTDRGPDTIRDLKIKRIDFPFNRGKGAAIKHAGYWAEKHGYTHIITMDADGQHNPDEVDKFLSLIKKDPLTIIIGKRIFQNQNIPKKSQFGRNFSNFWIKTLTGKNVEDSQSGFRAYPVEAITKVKCRTNRYNFEIEVLVRGLWAGLKVKTIDISVIYNEETAGSSHFKPFIDNTRISLTFTRLFLRHLMPVPHKSLFGPSSGRKIMHYFFNPKEFFKMILTENTSVNRIILSCMLGIFLGTLPLIGVHSFIIFFFATKLRLNRLIAFNINHLCAPPFVPAACIEVGHFLRYQRFIILDEDTISTLGNNIWVYITDYLIGSIVMAPVFACIVGFIVYIILSIVKRVKIKKTKKEYI